MSHLPLLLLALSAAACQGDSLERFAGLYPHRPANHTHVVSSYGFEDPPPLAVGTAMGGGWSVNNYRDMSRVIDSTAPVSPPSVLQWAYRKGDPSGTTVGIAYHPYPASTRELFVGFSVWHDPNFEWNPISNKLFYIEPGNIILETRENEDYLSVYVGASGTMYKATNPVTVPLGKWVNIEMLVRRGDPGLIRVWMNGTLVMDRMVPVPPPGKFGELKLDSTWGGATGPRTRDSFRRVDHILVTTP
jgi:hypothetical protein